MEGAGAKSCFKKGGTMFMLMMVLLVVVVVNVGGVSARGGMVINQSTVPITIERVRDDGVNESMVVGAHASMELPVTFSASAITLSNQLTGGTFGPLTLGRNAVMLIQSTGGLLSKTVTVLLGTLVTGVISALSTIIAGL